MKQFKVQSKEAVNVLRERALKMDGKSLTTVELTLLQEFKNEIEKRLGTRQRPLDTSCSSCIMTELKRLKNYIENHEPRNEEQPVEITEEVGLEIEVEFDLDEDTLRGMKLKELRNLYPEIKATSVDTFVDKLINGDYE